ncbi:PREDICTED: tetratricopeptide repeat protein 1 isoform X2 [Gekko japonicus]|nr:PREDICTED: tetratricopeptide repeat protein 1 isoform X2 [Gekko japonicus]XP_015271337.1 PREDICTED: tetratricopeptide repeat protein 1 isoform X2 [Gekko japonicus]XP_015271338.1 PREDICTED: tetratricopeptide repeat protein 1 isoform X2 [Gekko japonicus]XP_015271339.1 PREDICTED: tetratricopeptide repeat protein 1 isoform X2 [Gekko japonicus]XP_015271340.1 PREDICTED: tetratricopeptide repeat protein 1 isoform X2 [Gekko japonicus]XP_015271342.1 PREDICTED: tetratricopeptide repeat protein 1 isof
MESEDAIPEKLVEGLKLSEDQSYISQTECDNVHIPRISEAREDDDLFHDCNDSFESRVTEENHNCEVDSSEKQTDLDEKYLLELEKDMSEEEKQKRRNESIKLKEEGNEQFKRKEYEEAEDSYAKALKVCPACYSTDRSVLYSNRAAARMKQDKKEAAIGDCSKALELNPDYIKALLRRAELYEKTEKLDEALEDYKNVLEKDPSVHQAREASLRLPRQIEERNEKLKKEMLGKLKDLGNFVLRPFGLSTDNFQMKQDSATGSYSINFVQNNNR